MLEDKLEIYMAIYECNMFIQTGVSCDRLKLVSDFLEKKTIKTLDWRANSPDLNPFKDLWAILEDKVADEHLTSARRCRLESCPLQVRHKRDWGREFILLLPQAVVLPESDAGSDVIKPTSGFVIQNRHTLCYMWCPMNRARC